MCIFFIRDDFGGLGKVRASLVDMKSVFIYRAWVTLEKTYICSKRPDESLKPKIYAE